MDRSVIYTTRDGTDIFVEPGSKSPLDFKVRYQNQGKYARTPKHIHLIIDLYLKRAGDKELTREFVEQLLSLLDRLQPAISYPPAFQVFTPGMFSRFELLNRFGEYPVDFLAAIFELIMIQEKTNYPTGTLNRKMMETFLSGKDIFSVVSTATFRG